MNAKEATQVVVNGLEPTAGMTGSTTYVEAMDEALWPVGVPYALAAIWVRKDTESTWPFPSP